MPTTFQNRSMIYLLGICSVLCLAACADQSVQSAAAPTITVPNDHLIVAGVRMGPFVLGMSETQLLAMGQPSSREAMYLSGVNAETTTNIPSVRYCYWDQNICVIVSQADHLLHSIYLDPMGAPTPYKTQSGAGIGYSMSQLDHSFDLGTPDMNLNFEDRVFHPGFYLYVGFDGPGDNSTTLFYFINKGWNESQPPRTHVRAINMYDNHFIPGFNTYPPE